MTQQQATCQAGITYLNLTYPGWPWMLERPIDLSSHADSIIGQLMGDETQWCRDTGLHAATLGMDLTTDQQENEPDPVAAYAKLSMVWNQYVQGRRMTEPSPFPRILSGHFS